MFFRGEVDFDQEPRGDQVMTREGPFWALTTRKAYLLTTDIMCEAKLNAHGQHWPQPQKVSAIFETWQSFVVCNDHVDEWIDKFYQIFIKVLQALLCQLHLGTACSQLDHPTLRSRSCRGCWRYKTFFYHNCRSFSFIDTWSRCCCSCCCCRHVGVGHN